MLRSLGITTALKWFAVACVVVAVYRGYNGDVGAVITTVWGWVQSGADAVTNIWHSVDSTTTAPAFDPAPAPPPAARTA